jgi:hypothetical protein
MHNIIGKYICKNFLSFVFFSIFIVIYLLAQTDMLSKALSFAYVRRILLI